MDEQSDAILKLPTLVQKLQRVVEAAGIRPDQLQIVEIRPDATGKKQELELRATPEITEILIAILGMKLFSPEKESPSIRTEPIPPSGQEPKISLKLWAPTERQKRSKPPGDIPDLSNR